MTHLSATAGPGAPPISFQDHDSEYRAGACNIGPAEIRRRRNFGHVALLFTIALYALLVVQDVPAIVRFIVALPAAVAVACYMEAFLKFCIGFGWLGVFNFGARGATQQVADESARAADRWRSLRLTALLAVICVAIGVVAVLLPV